MEIKKLTDNGYILTKEGNNYQLDYGEIKKLTDTTTAFEFMDIQVKGFKIEPTCQCTIVVPTIEGDTAKANITYSAKSLGSFNKTVKIHNRGKITELKLKGTVI